MSWYSAIRQSVQYAVVSVALLAGVGAGHVSRKYEKPGEIFVRGPGEPCVLPAEHRKDEKPVEFPKGVVYFGLAALVVAYVADKNRKKAESFVVSRPDNPKNFFGKED
jgi:hypothetical protein